MRICCAGLFGLLLVCSAQPSIGQPVGGQSLHSGSTAATERVANDIPASELRINTADRRAIRIALAGPEMVQGAFDAAQPIVSLDATLSGSQQTLSASRRQLVSELRELAATQLAKGLEVARSANGTSAFPQAEVREIRYWTQVASAASSRLGPDRVRTYISGPDSSWELSYVTLEDHKRHELTWQPYSYGTPMDIKAYVFRLRGAGGSTGQCERSVAVWDDPTKYQLSC
jgi:hypothetical protein